MSNGSAVIIAQLKAAGTTIVFITHRMREVRAFCDTLTILRNGQHITTCAVAAITDAQVIESIVGRIIAQTFPARPKGDAAFGAPVLGCARSKGRSQAAQCEL